MPIHDYMNIYVGDGSRLKTIPLCENHLVADRTSWVAALGSNADLSC